MKKRLLLFALSLVIFSFSLTISLAQTWKENSSKIKELLTKGKYDSAMVYAEKGIILAEKEYGTKDTLYAVSIGFLGSINERLGKYELAESYYKQSLKIFEEVPGGKNTDYAGNLNNLALLEERLGKHEQSEAHHKQALQIFKELLGEKDPDYARSLNNLAVLYSKMDKYNLAESLFKQSMELRKEVLGEHHEDYANSLGNIARLYDKMGRYDLVEPLYIQALQIYKEQLGEKHPTYATYLNHMALFYYSTGKYNEAEQLYKNALNIYKETLGEKHPQYATTLNNLGLIYDVMGYYGKAEPLYKEAMQIIIEKHGDRSLQYSWCLGLIGGLYKDMGRYAEAEPLYKQTLDIKKAMKGERSPDYANSLGNLAQLYGKMKKHELQEQYLKEALQIQKETLGENHPSYANSLGNLATLYRDQGKYDEAEPLLKKSIQISKEKLGEKHAEYALGIHNLAGLYNRMGKYDEAEPLYKQALEILKDQFGGHHPNYSTIMYNLATFYFDLGKNEQAEPYMKQVLEMNKFNFSKNSVFLSEREKEKLWNMTKFSFDMFNSFCMLRMKENPSILCPMFDNQLEVKALIFNNSNKIKKRILNSKDSTLIEQFTKSNNLKESLIKYYSMSKPELTKKQVNIDSLEKVLNNLEKEISLKSEDYKLSYEKKKIDWHTIQAALQPDEAVIELVRFILFANKRFTDTIFYAALIVSDQTTENPDIVILENGNELEDKYYTSYRNSVKNKTKDTESFQNFWSKIYEKTKQYKKVYFSPDGVFNKLNISTFEMPDGKYLLEHQDIQTMNSSKDLLLSFYSRREESNVYNNTLLIGNPDFGLDSAQIAKPDKNLFAERALGVRYISSLRDIHLAELPGTEKEVNNIEQYLKTKNWVVKKFLKTEATKLQVKTANNPRVLHIATHGFFLPALEINDYKQTSSNPLFQTGLFFAGASSPQSEENIDVGFLTAYEAMNLELDKTDLVVLSACETGLGEIRNGEGVFGLRRAFQQAGAKSVLMSLWKVDDEATQELMTNFYKEWLSGKTKREAFQIAQMKIKDKYKYPYFWGAFVMVGE